MSINQVEDIFTKSRIDFQKTDISHIPWLILLPDDVKNYLECMGKTLKWHETQYGSAWTTLYGVNELMDYQETVCHKNNLLVIGNGLNGDLLTIATVYKGNIIKFNNGLPILRRDTAQTRLRAVFL